jgi:hypothetical protein
MSAEKEPNSSTTTTTAPPKYSRYRSVRRAANTDPEPPPPVEVKPNDDGVTRSMSRYRRSRVATKTDHLVGSPPVPVMPQLPRALHAQSVTADSRPVGMGRDVARRVTDPVSSSQRPHQGVVDARRPRETESERARRKAKEAQLREEQERVATQHAEAQKVREAEEEATRILAEQKRKDLERLEAELEAAAPAQRVTSPREKMKFFSRKRGLTKTTPPPTAGSGSESAAGSASLARPRTRSNEPSIGMGPPRSMDQPRMTEQPSIPEESRAPELPKVIEQGGGGIVPQTDAPISASNAGERVS